MKESVCLEVQSLEGNKLLTSKNILEIKDKSRAKGLEKSSL